MDADWYEDPLERFEGRFFDGERWTERVSDDGVLVIDPDFPPPGAGDVEPEAAADEFETVDAPAVATVRGPEPLQASLIEESPVRIVAVLDADLVDRVATHRSDIAPSDDSERDRSYLVWGLLGVVGVLAIVAMLVLSRNGSTDVVAQPVDLDEQQEERVQDLADGGVDSEGENGVIEELEVDAPDDAPETDAVFDRDELVEVGALRVLNGASVLDDLEAWHQDFAAERGVELGADAACWFGQLGGAAVQVAQCGPVGGSAQSEFLFDMVPLVFEDTDGGQLVQPVLDAATIDGVLPNALTLIGAEDSPAPPVSAQGATSNDRVAEDEDE